MFGEDLNNWYPMNVWPNVWPGDTYPIHPVRTQNCDIEWMFEQTRFMHPDWRKNAQAIPPERRTRLRIYITLPGSLPCLTTTYCLPYNLSALWTGLQPFALLTNYEPDCLITRRMVYIHASNTIAYSADSPGFGLTINNKALKVARM